jgi:hypothetical protein
VLNGGLEQEEQKINMKKIEIMQPEQKENTLKFTECVTGI